MCYFRNYAIPNLLTFFPKKNASFDRLAFITVFYTYFVAGAAGSAGVAGIAAGASDFSMILESLSLNDPVKLKLDSKISEIIN